MSGALLVAVCLVAGWLLRSAKRVSDEGAATLARVVIDVALPCLTFRGVRALRAESARALWAPVASVWMTFFVALVALWTIARLARWPRSTVGALVVTATVGNTAFVGLPLIEGLLGRSALPTATLIDQGGSFVIVSTASVLLAASFAGRDAKLGVLVTKLVTFPPVIGSALGLLTRPIAMPTALDALVERLASLVVPLALLSVGMRLRVRRSELVRDAGPLAAGLFVKLVLAPAITLLFASSIGLRGERLAVTIAQCGMAPMVTAGMIAAEHELNPSLASSLVAAGVFLSLVTVPLWTWGLAAAGL